ncbi:MAG: hypothetical protein Q4G33_13455, partial [bacterium]|nr:hypothetical protein [bacterium]
GENNSDIRESRKNNYVALHNIDENKLRSAFELGGLAMPSLAVTKAGHQHSGFGDITLVFGRDTVDPQTNSDNKLYGGDAYTPVFPQVVNAPIESEVKRLANHIGVSENYLNDNFFSGKTKDAAVTAMMEDANIKSVFARDTGLKVEPVLRMPKMTYPFHNSEAARRYISENTFEDMLSDPEGYISAISNLGLKNGFGSGIRARRIEKARDFLESAKHSYAEAKTSYDQDRSIALGTAVPTADAYSYRDGLDNLIETHKAEYRQYVNNIADRVMGEKQIRNNNDFRNPDGSPRSFDELHDKYSLDNVVRNMRAALQKGESSFMTGANNVRGAVTRNFSSIDDMKSDGGRIRDLSAEEIDAIRRDFSDRLAAIADEAAPRGEDNYLNDFSQMLIEIINESDSMTDFRARLKGNGYYNISDLTLSKIEKLIHDMGSAPTKYFEAKPQRAVGFNEVKAAVVPNGTSNDIINKLQQHGIRVVSYPNGDEAARTAAIEKLDGVRFSRKAAPGTDINNNSYSYNDLISKPDMPVTLLTEKLPLNENGKIDRAKVSKIALSNARKQNNPKNTDSTTFVHVDDLGIDVVVGLSGIRHGLARNPDNTAIATMQIGDILKNAVAINELNARGDTMGGLVLLGAGKDADGNYYPTRIIVNNYEVNDIEPLGVVYAIKAKKERSARRNDARLTTNVTAFYTPSTISIADLLDIVKKHFPDILPQNVLQHYNMARPNSPLSDSVRFSRKAAPGTDENGNKVKSSQLFENSMHKEHYSDEFRAEADKRKNDFYYEKHSNEQDYNDAVKRIEEVGADKVLNELYRTEKWSAEHTADALALVEHFNRSKDYSSAVDVYELARKHTTQAAQAVQAWAIIDRLTPEGQYIALQRENQKLIDKQVEKMQPKRREQFEKDIKNARELDRKERQPRRVFSKQEESDIIDNHELPFGNEPPAIGKRVFGKQEELDIPKETKPSHKVIPPEEFGIYSNYFEEEDVKAAVEQQQKLTEAEEAEARRKTHVDDVLDMYNINRINGSEMLDAASILHDIDKIDSKEALIDKIIQQSKERHTAAGKSVIKALQAQDIELLKQVAIQQVFGKIADAEPSTFARKISTFQTVQHLMNAKTMLRNMGSNGLFNTVDTAAVDIGAVIDSIIGAFYKGVTHMDGPARRTVAFQRGLAEKGAYGARLDRARRAFIDKALDVDTGAAEGSKYNGLETSRRTFKGQGRLLSRAAAGIERGLGYGLNVTDEWTKGGIEYHITKSLERLRDSGKAWYSDEEIKQIAEDEARYRTFQDDSPVARLLTGIKAALNIIGIGDVQKQYGPLKSHEFGLGDFVCKYTRVPGNLIWRFIEYSPTGYFKTIYHIGRAIYENTQGSGFTAKQQRDISMSLGRAMTGSGIMAAFYFLSKLGLFIGEREDEGANQKNLENSEGISSTQLNVSALGRWVGSGFKNKPELENGDILVNLGFLEPLNTQMALGYGLAVSDPNGFSLSNVGKVTGAKVFDQIIDMPTMSTLKSVFDTIHYGGTGTDAAIAIAVSGLTGFEGSLLRQTAGFLDTSARNPYNNEGEVKIGLAQLMQNIPKLREQVNERITPFGEIRSNTSGNRILDFLNSFINPGNVNIYQTTDVSGELYSLADYDDNVIPSKAPSSFDAAGESYKLYGDEYEEFARLYGQTAYDSLKEVINSDYYTDMTDDEKAEALADVVSKSATSAKQLWAVEHGSELKEGNSGIGSVTYDGVKYELSPAVKVKYDRAVELKTNEYKSALNNKAVEDVLGDYKAMYYYNDLSEADRQKYIADYDHKIANARGGKKNTKEELQAKYRQQKEEFLNGKRYKEIEVTGNYSDLPASIQKQVMKRAETVATNAVQAEMREEIISGASADATAAPEATAVPVAAASDKSEKRVFGQSSSGSGKTLAAAFKEETDGIRRVFGLPETQQPRKIAFGYAPPIGKTAASTASAPAATKATTSGNSGSRKRSGSSRRRSSGGSSRKRSGGSRSSSGSGGSYRAVSPTLVSAAAQTYSNTLPAVSSAPSVSSYLPYNSYGKYDTKTTAAITARYHSGYYVPIVSNNVRIRDIIPQGLTLRRDDGSVVNADGFFYELSPDLQQLVIQALQKQAESDIVGEVV